VPRRHLPKLLPVVPCQVAWVAAIYTPTRQGSDTKFLGPNTLYDALKIPRLCCSKLALHHLFRSLLRCILLSPSSTTDRMPKRDKRHIKTLLWRCINQYYLRRMARTARYIVQLRTLFMLSGWISAGRGAKLGVLGTCSVSKLETPHIDGRPASIPAPPSSQRRTTALKEPQSISWSPRDATHRGSLSQCALWSCPEMSSPNSVQDGRSLGS